ncbi:uncharacterized protein [Cicer arietinum]|uniref:Uncharacterized protein LOC101503105 n=1 Tax=Cicer arietinum TaxID=3827 RepID=A0A1S3DZE9_CICAR|nr:uncharacterized protein LOC101503105 [Cicer arietinum]
MVRKMMKNVKDDGELEMLLDEIPHATSHIDDDNGNGVNVMYDDEDHLNYQIKFSTASSSPVTISGFSSLQSDGSSSSLFSSDNGSPTTTPLMEDFKSTMSSGTGRISSYNPNNTFCLDSNTQRFVDEFGLCGNFSKMYIGSSNHQQEQHNHNVNPNPNVFPVRDFTSWNENNPINVHNNHINKHVDYNSNNIGLLDFDSDADFVGIQSPLLRNPISINHNGAEMNSALTRDYELADSTGLQPCTGWRKRDTIYSQFNGFGGGSVDSPCYRRHPTPELDASSLSRNSAVDASLYAQKYGMNLMQDMSMSRLPNFPLRTNLKPCMSAQDLMNCSLHLPDARVVPPSNARMLPGNIDIDAITSRGSLILQGEGLNYVAASGSNGSRCQNAARESGFARHLHRLELDILQRPILGTYENLRSSRIGYPCTLPPKYNSLSEARGCIYLIAKDQNGCRFLQRMFDEGRTKDAQVIFNEIIGHVVELMMNPFGNYLMQKLLDVCSEEQRTQIILMVTQEPGQLVRISLNSHGTRVVQKLIETLKTRQQISLVVSALEPGFLALIKDLNGNHVIQHCLQCLSNEDNKFIFAVAAKYCVDIATHQHGCCVLQKCIGYSSGEHREKLVAEISSNVLMLAQDKYGNYVVQFILDLRIPSATATLISQFEGNYVHLSLQKFSSHVVEKCLVVFNNENRTEIIHELLSAPHFDQLLQDAHANYVIQKALRHSEGHVYNSLVETIESYKATCRNSPYSKKIFAHKLLKKRCVYSH